MTAGSDPPSPDDPGASRQRSGPADVSASLLVAARRGDPGAFATFVEHWDPHLRPFVHHTLAGDGDTDRVLGAAYVRAFRALPRYRPTRTPGLWLHRIAYLAAIDELRRLGRDPLRRRGRTHPVRGADDRPPTPGPADPVARALHDLAPDQRAIALMVDLEGFGPPVVAEAFDTAPGVVAGRLASARRALIAAADPDGAHELPAPPEVDAPVTPTVRPRPGATDAGGPDAPAVNAVADPLGGVLVAGSVAVPVADLVAPTPDPDAAFPIPAWAEDLGPPPPAAADEVAATAPGGAEAPEAPADEAPADEAPVATSRPADPEARAAAVVRAALLALPVPPPADGFWTALGRRLLAERERPAAPTPDPVARLARAHPAELGFHPASAHTSVADLATQAGRTRPRRRWARPLAIALAVVAVAGIVAGAVAIGISGRTPDGSVSGTELAVDVAGALDSSRFLKVQVTVEERTTASPDELVRQGHEVTIAEDGSYLVSGTDAIDQTTYSAADGLYRRVLVVAGEAGAPPAVLVAEQRDLAAGPPDPTAPTPPLLDELRAVTTLLRSGSPRRVPATTVGGVATWTDRRTVGTGPDGADEEWRVSVRRSDGFPMRIERRRDGRVVRRLRFSGWTPASTVPLTAFAQPLPDGGARSLTTHGFRPVDLAAVPLLGRGDARTPAWLPEGFELATVAALGAAPAQAPTTGDGTNPPDVAVLSLGYQRGPERITITTRASSAPETDWSDPFVGGADGGAVPTDAAAEAQERTLGDGHFNQVPVRITTDAVGRARLWGVDDDVVLTVSGDLTAADAYRVAASLR